LHPSSARTTFDTQGTRDPCQAESALVEVSDVERQIKAAFLRNAEFEAENIVVTAEGRAVTLTGQVGSYYARTLAAETAWSAPGVTEVYELLTID